MLLKRTRSTYINNKSKRKKRKTSKSQMEVNFITVDTETNMENCAEEHIYNKPAFGDLKS